MRKFVISAAAAAVLALGSVTAVLAGSPNHTAPGTPGDDNCHGQTAAFLAQLAANAGVPGANGIGGVAQALGMSVQDVQALVDAYCASGG